MAYFNFHKCFCGSRNSAPPVPTPITAAQFAAAALFWDIVHHNKFCRELISLLELSMKSGNERWDFIKFAKNYRKKWNRRKRNTKHMALDGSTQPTTESSVQYGTGYDGVEADNDLRFEPTETFIHHWHPRDNWRTSCPISEPSQSMAWELPGTPGGG